MTRTSIKALAAAALLTAVAARPVVAQNAGGYHIGRLAYDQHCMTIDGRDQVLFSGAFHYFRCPKPLWADRFRTLKAAGFNTLETYAAWNWHEQTPPAGPDDYSKLDMTDLHDWLEMATQQFGFYVVLRPGPYICAEWDGGGYPQWLLPLRPKDYKGKMWVRSDDPVYLAWSKHWYTAVAKVAVPYQLTHQPAGRGGIILWQVENEYDYSKQPIAVKVAQVSALAHLSRDLGIDVPLLTCLTNTPDYHQDAYLRENVVQSANTYPGFDLKVLDRDLHTSMDQQPEKFRMVTELQAGWFAQVGGKLSDQQGHNAAHINQLTLYAYENGFTSTNYYMGFGGTNFGDWAAQTLITSYDYNAPVREPGGTTERYQAVKGLGQFIAEHGSSLARSDLADISVNQKTDDDVHVAVRRAADGDYVFVRTATRDATRKGTVDLQVKSPGTAKQIKLDYELGDFGAKVLFVPSSGDPVWYPKPQALPKRPTDLPAALTITDARRMPDPGPTVWHPFDPTKTEADCGIFDRGFVFYHANLPTAGTVIGSDQHASLTFDLAGTDSAVVNVEGKRVRGDDGAYVVAGQTHEGSLSADVLYDNGGRPNFGEELEQPGGVLNGRAISANEMPVSLGGWREHRLESGHKPTAEVASDFDDGSWPAADVTADVGDLQPRESAVYRATVTLTDVQVAEGRSLTLGSIDDDGQVFVNGQPAATSRDWATPVHVDITKYLHAGRNVVAVVVHNKDNGGGLCHGARLVPLGKPMPVQWTMSQDGQGALNHWYAASFDDSQWTPIKLGDAPAANDAALLTWTRFKFELPTPKPNEWVPWKLTLNATGNGFLYLNGHALGRWWEVGPQKDYYVPECWLNFGPGQTNVITTSLHATADNAAVVKSASVSPYAEQAEVR